MFNPLVGHIVMALAVMACVGSLLGWQFTLAQTAKMTADQNLFLKFFSKVNAMNAPVVGMIVCGLLQTLMALSTISPDAAAQFSKLVNLAAVTNLIPYLTALTGLLVIMYKAGVSTTIYARNLVVLLVAVTYSLYALYACGKEAVMGGTLVLAFGYLLYGFLAKRFTDTLPAEQAGAGNP
jgi:putrescine:ornithine antiporter